MSVMNAVPDEKADKKFMRAAIVQARKAEKLDEVPIGCVIVYEGKIIARGYNRRNTDLNTISHAEMNAIRRRLYYLYNAGTLPDVFRGYSSVKNRQMCHRCHEPEGRMCRFCNESAAGCSV